MCVDFDGTTIPALPGETIAAALAASGRPALRRTESGAPSRGQRREEWRGQWCGMGACYDCIVTVDGRVGQRACLTKVQGGEVIRSLPPAGTADDPLNALAVEPDNDRATRNSDLLIIGAGPAGLAAACEAARAGAHVTVLDERAEAGGQYFKPVNAAHHTGLGIDAQMRQGARLVRAADALGVQRVHGALVWGATRPDEVLALVNGKVVLFRQRALVLATGAVQQAAPIPGWTLPGVMSTGAAQTLSRSHQVAPGRRVVVAGNGPLNFQLAADLAGHGVTVAAVVEAAPRPALQRWRDLWSALAADPANMLRGVGYLATLARHRVPIYWSHAAARAVGQDALSAVALQPVDAAGTSSGAEIFIDADALCLGPGFQSATEMAATLGCAIIRDPRQTGTQQVAVNADGATSVPGVFAAGDGAVVGGAALAQARGAVAGAAAARSLGFGARQPRAALRKAERSARFQSALWRVFRAPPCPLAAVADETVLCRCETLTFGNVRTAVDSGATSLAALKRRLRLGMGRCQGRVCAPVAAALLTDISGRDAVPQFAPRLPLKPFPAAALAREKPEWGGHERAGTPNLARASAAPPCPPEEADVVVIGGGVVGACVAYELCTAGLDVLLVERDEVNLQASGSNAGSLHVQLLSFDFGDKAEAGGGPAAATLPLGPLAVSLWEDLAKACDHDFEIRRTGGLMVASNETGMAFLRAKAQVERRHGIDTHIIGPSELQRIAPALNPALVGAAFVAEEGKINPLTATYSVMAQAEARGARLRTCANVTGLTRGSNSWTVETSRGPIRSGRVINAAGPWARPVAALAGIDVPVHSAPLQMVVTERAPPLVDQLVAHADRHLSLKQLAAGGLVIGGAWPARYDPSRNMNRTTIDSVEGNIWVAREVLPQLAGLHIVRTWAGMNVNIDGAPIVGEVPGVPGFFNCVTSNGYTLAPAVARLTAELMIDGRTSVDIAPYSIARF